LSLFSFFTFRRTLYVKIRGGSENYPETLAGETISLVDDLEPGAEARTQYRGSGWTVRNVDSKTISGGGRAKVVKVEGLTLHVVAK
jgi:membrane protein implicated in regulation of membrane protease activity